MSKISAIVITLNEENNIAACLESLRWVDEIVVMDSGSHDRTREIARTFTTMIFETRWQGYGETKNVALNKTNGDWILWVDADERVTPQLAKDIRNRLEVDGGRYSGYEMARLAFFLKRPLRHGGWYPGYVLRLFKREAGRFSVPAVHEGVVLKGSRSRLKGDLLHDTDPTLEHYLKKMNHYTTLAADELCKKGIKAGLFDLLLRPQVMFFKMFFLKAGYRDGIPGFLVALLSAFHVLTKYAKLWERRGKKS